MTDARIPDIGSDLTADDADELEQAQPLQGETAAASLRRAGELGDTSDDGVSDEDSEDS